MQNDWTNGDWQDRPRTVTLRNARAIRALFESLRMLSPTCCAQATAYDSLRSVWRVVASKGAVTWADILEAGKDDGSPGPFYLPEPTPVTVTVTGTVTRPGVEAPLPGTPAYVEAAARHHIYGARTFDELMDRIADYIPAGGTVEAERIAVRVWVAERVKPNGPERGTWWDTDHEGGTPEDVGLAEYGEIRLTPDFSADTIVRCLVRYMLRGGGCAFDSVAVVPVCGQDTVEVKYRDPDNPDNGEDARNVWVQHVFLDKCETVADVEAKLANEYRNLHGRSPIYGARAKAVGS